MSTSFESRDVYHHRYYWLSSETNTSTLHPVNQLTMANDMIDFVNSQVFGRSFKSLKSLKSVDLEDFSFGLFFMDRDQQSIRLTEENRRGGNYEGFILYDYQGRGIAGFKRRFSQAPFLIKWSLSRRRTSRQTFTGTLTGFFSRLLTRRGRIWQTKASIFPPYAQPAGTAMQYMSSWKRRLLRAARRLRSCFLIWLDSQWDMIIRLLPWSGPII